MSREFKSLCGPYSATRADLLDSGTVNIVLATDIFDKELNDRRKTRWDRAFAKKSIRILMATIVIEHIIQASDVAHDAALARLPKVEP
jgi:hypothetical protein